MAIVLEYFLVMRMYDTVIFDLDGTLLNTLNDLYQSCNMALMQFGYPPRTYEEIQQFVGHGIKNLIYRALPTNQKEALEAVYEAFLTIYEKHQLDTTRPYPNILELLEQLSQRKIKMAIVSNKIDSAAKTIAAAFFLQYPMMVIGETLKLKRKPAPDMLLEALSKLSSQKQTTLFVGDSETDIETAKNAQIDVCAVTWGFRSEALLKAEHPQYLISHPLELLKIIDGRHLN